MQYKAKLLFVTGVVGILLWVILPGAYKIIGYVASTVALSYALSSSKTLNVSVLIGLNVLYFMFPSSIFTLDSVSPYSLGFYSGLNAVSGWVNGVGGLFLIGIPILVLVGAVYAFAKGNIDQGVSSVIKLIIFILMVISFGFIMKLVGVESPYLQPIYSFVDIFWSIIKGITNFFAGIINKLDIGNLITDVPELPDDPFEMLVLDLIQEPADFMFVCFSSFPLISCFACFVVGIIFQFNTESAEKLLTKYSEKETIKFNPPGSSSVVFVIYWLIQSILVVALYVSRTLEQLLSRTSIIYLVYYITLSVAMVLMAIGFSSYTKTSKQTLFGLLYGVAGLFTFFNLFTQVRTLDIINLEYSTLTDSVIVAQLLFVAPTESMLFHVFAPGLVLYLILNYNKRYNLGDLNTQIDQLQDEVFLNDISIEFYKAADEKNKQQEKMLAILIRKKGTLTVKVQNLKRMKEHGLQIEGKLTAGQITLYFLLTVVVNVAFSVMHWFNSDLDFGAFWTSGLGLIYLASGIWLSYVSYRYGWPAGIITHAFNNCIGLLLLGGLA